MKKYGFEMVFSMLVIFSALEGLWEGIQRGFLWLVR